MWSFSVILYPCVHVFRFAVDLCLFVVVPVLFEVILKYLCVSEVAPNGYVYRCGCFVPLCSPSKSFCVSVSVCFSL